MSCIIRRQSQSRVLVNVFDFSSRLVPYPSASRLQQTLQSKLLKSSNEENPTDSLILLQHPPVFTAGIRTEQTSLPSSSPSSQESLIAEKLQIPLIWTRRGGSITYHGPRQLVCYPIVSLRHLQCTVREYVHMLEETIIRVVSRKYGIEGFRDKTAPGVWTNNGKIAAIGVRVSQGVAMHGFALNHSPDMAPFSAIVPCGLVGKKVTSMEEIMGKENLPLFEEVKEEILASMIEVLHLSRNNNEEEEGKEIERAERILEDESPLEERL